MTKEEQIYREARKSKACELLKGTENTGELIELFFTPKGIEFCAKYNTPSLDAFRRFMGVQATHGGFYIDTPIKAKNLPRTALIGTETIAELEFTETKGYTVVVMHGATVKIKASGYAVVFLTNAGGTVETEIKDSAKVFE